jgi:uncharacterized repeat protein (TIGR03803 family)
MTLGGTFTPLHSFDHVESPYPPSGFINAIDGNLYGTTGFGYSGTATLFKVSPTGIVTTLYAFQDSPGGLLTQAVDGTFFGTTYGGGSTNEGSVFQLSLSAAPLIDPLKGVANSASFASTPRWAASTIILLAI